jgi:nicotinamidase-related amidase
MMAWARSRNIPVISTCQVNIINNNGGSEFDYCLDATEGQKKVSYTLLSRRVNFAADNSTDLPVDILRRYRQIVFHKRCIDPFAEPRIERLLTELKAEEFILIGALAEEAVMATALGLLQRGKKVSVTVDAVGSRDNYEGKLAFRKMEAKGARLVETKKLAGTSHLKQAGICHCDSCRDILKQKTIGAAG